MCLHRIDFLTVGWSWVESDTFLLEFLVILSYKSSSYRPKLYVTSFAFRISYYLIQKYYFYVSWSLDTTFTLQAAMFCNAKIARNFVIKKFYAILRYKSSNNKPVYGP